MKFGICRGPGENGGIFRRFCELCRYGAAKHDVLGLLLLADVDGDLDEPVRTRVYSRRTLLPGLIGAESIEDILEACEPLIGRLASDLSREGVEAVLACDTDLKALCAIAACKRVSVRVTTFVAGLTTLESQYENNAVPLWANLVERYCMETSNRLIFPAEPVARLCAGRYPKLAPHTVVYNGICEEFVRQHAPKERDVFGAVMRLSAIKNPKALGRIATRLAEHGFETELITDTQARAARRALRHVGHLRLRPPLRSTKALAKFYGSCRAIIVPSHFEASGNVPMEALATGTPAMITEGVGMRDLYRELGLDHLIVPVDDDDAALDCLLNAKPVTAQIRQRVAEVCSWPRACERIISQL